MGKNRKSEIANSRRVRQRADEVHILALPGATPGPATKCSSCRYVVQEGENHFCYRNPPQAVVINQMVDGPKIMSQRPSVKAEWWCGMWEKRA